MSHYSFADRQLLPHFDNSIIVSPHTKKCANLFVDFVGKSWTTQPKFNNTLTHVVID